MKNKPIIFGPINKTRSYLGHPHQHLTRQEKINYSQSQVTEKVSYRHLGNGYISFIREENPRSHE